MDAGNPKYSGDQGQATGLVVMSIALIGMFAVAIASVAGRMAEHSRAQNAADAAALAGATGGQPAASIAAARNGAALVNFVDDRRGQDVAVTVEVVVGGEHAVARASTGP